MFTSADVELCAVHRTRDGGAAKSALREARIAMRAVVVERVQPTVDTTHDDTMLADVREDSHGSVAKVGKVAEIDVVHDSSTANPPARRYSLTRCCR